MTLYSQTLDELDSKRGCCCILILSNGVRDVARLAEELWQKLEVLRERKGGTRVHVDARVGRQHAREQRSA